MPYVATTRTRARSARRRSRGGIADPPTSTASKLRSASAPPGWSSSRSSWVGTRLVYRRRAGLEPLRRRDELARGEAVREVHREGSASRHPVSAAAPGGRRRGGPAARAATGRCHRAASASPARSPAGRRRSAGRAWGYRSTQRCRRRRRARPAARPGRARARRAAGPTRRTAAPARNRSSPRRGGGGGRGMPVPRGRRAARTVVPVGGRLRLIGGCGPASRRESRSRGAGGRWSAGRDVGGASSGPVTISAVA